jgi:hypothetical protein
MNPFIHWAPHGLCRKCRAAICAEAEVERERVKNDLLSARILKDNDEKVQHLQSALDRTRKLFRYERLGCLQPNPSPKALKAFLEEKLREAAALRQAERARKNALTVPREVEEEFGEGNSLSAASGARDGYDSRDTVGNGGNGNEDAALQGTRRGPRHSAMMRVLMDHTTPAMTEDISSRGLCVRTASLLKPGSRVGLMIKAPHGQVSGEGMVRWAQRKLEADGGSRQVVMGVEFLVPQPELEQFG